MAKAVLTIIMTLVLQTTAPTNASIGGVVRNASNGAPLPSVQVTAIRISTPGAARGQASKALPSVSTDNSGRFVIANLVAGSYRVYAVRAGFGGMEYKQRPVSRAGDPVEVAPGQFVANTDFNLAVAGVVTGHVTDPSGVPLARIDVQLLAPAYDGRGTRSFHPVDSAVSDDLGQYRLFGITPGRYYLRAAIPPSSAEAVVLAESLLGIGNNAIQNSVTESIGAKVALTVPPPIGYGNMYYPGVTDSVQARLLDIPPGPALVTADFKLRNEATVHVRGRVVDKQTGQPPRNVTITLHAGSIGEGSPKTATNFQTDTGTFDIADVRPGSYTLTAVSTSGAGLLGALSAALENNAAPNPPRGARPTAKSATMHVDVPATDVGGILLKLDETANVQGHLAMADGTALSALPGFERIHVRLISSALPAPSANALAVVANGRPQVQPDGSFTLTTETNCDCEVLVTGLPLDAYVQGIRLGDVSVAGTRLTIPDPLPGPLNITISPAGGRIDGTLVDGNGQVLKGVEAVLIPEKRERQDLYKTAVSNASGQFTLQGIAPGAYKIFAWRDIEDNGYRNAAVLQPYEGRGQSVAIKDSSTLTLRVTAIQ